MSYPKSDGIYRPDRPIGPARRVVSEFFGLERQSRPSPANPHGSRTRG